MRAYKPGFFTLPKSTLVRVDIIDLLGRTIATPLLRTLTAGEHRVIWNGQTHDGQHWRLPLQAIQGTPKIGQEVRLVGVATGAEDAGQSAFAKALLNEILNSSSS